MVDTTGTHVLNQLGLNEKRVKFITNHAAGVRGDNVQLVNLQTTANVLSQSDNVNVVHHAQLSVSIIPEGGDTAGMMSVGVSCRYTNYYQGRGHSIRLTAAVINIHEHLI